MIDIADLTFYYSNTAQPSLRNINLKIGQGEFVLITGASGSGKSSLCRCLNGLIPHFYGGTISGSVKVCGIETTASSTRELARRVGMIFQDPENQLVTTDVEREIAFGLENMALPPQLIAKRIEEALDITGISALRYRPLHSLSGGEKQKVAIASIMALHPEVLVLDEPTSELDPKSSEEVLTTLQRLNDELGITVILIEHRLDRVIHLVDRLIIMDKGAIVLDGEPRRILAANDITRLGIGVPPIIALAHRLGKKGISFNVLPLTVKEGRSALNGCLSHIRKRSFQKENTNGHRPSIEIKDLGYAYRDGAAVLRKVSLTLHEGELVALMGRNASGKSTLVKHLNGLLKPVRGNVRVYGTDTRDATVAQMARQVGLVFQNPNDHLFADTVEQEIAFSLKQMGHSSAEIETRVERMLQTFDLLPYRRHFPRLLSGGQKQRVALASVMAACPKILALDEPTRGMEYGLKRRLLDLLRDYTREGNTVILVTHDVESVAEHADRVIRLSEGRVVVDAPRREALARALLFSPQINRLVQALSAYGVPEDILTVDELVELLP